MIRSKKSTKKKLKKSKKIDITFYFEDGFLICKVQDNGIGREAAQKRKKIYQSTHKSFATTILNERIKLLNSLNRGQFFFETEDLYDEKNNALGTLVTIGIPLDYNPRNYTISE